MPQPSITPVRPAKPQPRYSQLFRMSQSSAVSLNQKHQLEPFEIEPHSLTHQKVKEMIENWGAFDKIQEKFFVWEFSFGYQKILNIVPQQFYTMALYYVFMKKLHLLIHQFDQNQLLTASLNLKSIYKTQTLAGKLKGKRFDYLLLVTVKLVSFFLGAHTHEIIINPELQAQVYAILVFVLLGTQVGEGAYSSIIGRYAQKRVVRFNGRSQTYKITLILPNMSKHSSQHRQPMIQTIKSKKRIGMTECKSGTALFHQLDHDAEDSIYSELRQDVKANLAVKEFVPKPKAKETLDQVLARTKNIQVQFQELRQAKTIEKREIQHTKINYTQMSCSLDLAKNSESLNAIRNYGLKIKPQKRSKYYQMIPKQSLKSKSVHEQTPVKLPRIQKPKEEVYSYQAKVQKKLSGHYWQNIIGQMKENRPKCVERFPVIGERRYLQQEDAEETKMLRMSEALDVRDDKENVDPGNVEFLTERLAETPRSVTKLCKKASQVKVKKTVSILPTLDQIKNQIGITEFSGSTNVKQIYKDQKAFMNVYSSQPLDDLNQKLKKKSFAQWRDVEKKFFDQCTRRKQRIERNYFN